MNVVVAGAAFGMTHGLIAQYLSENGPTCINEMLLYCNIPKEDIVCALGQMYHAKIVSFNGTILDSGIWSLSSLNHSVPGFDEIIEKRIQRTRRRKGFWGCKSNAHLRKCIAKRRNAGKVSRARKKKESNNIKGQTQ